MELKFLIDGSKLAKEEINFWDLQSYINLYDGKYYANFVGFVIKKDEVLLSFPKRFDLDKLNDIEKRNILKKILNVIVDIDRTNGSNNLGNSDLFPFKSYFDIVFYYKKYGLHFSIEKEEVKGYSGNINWAKTFKKSQKYITNNSIIFLPFILNKKYNLGNFISECMEFILTDVFINYSAYFTGAIPYKKNLINPIFNNFELCYKKLISIKNRYFKDFEKKLINAIINYFKWKSQNSKNIKMLTTNFETYWEKLVENYLNKNFVSLDENENLIIESNKKDNNIKFKKIKEYVELDITQKYTNKYSIEFDHLYINNEIQVIYLFDSKYYSNEISGLNYKQAFYYYYLYNLYPNYKIHNGLILPTEKEYYNKVHVDRSKQENIEHNKKQDGLKIIEHYININQILDCYLNKN